MSRTLGFTRRATARWASTVAERRPPWFATWSRDVAEMMAWDTRMWRLKLRSDARALILRQFDYKHEHVAHLQFPAPVQLCRCGAFRDGLGRVDIHDTQWVVPGAAQRVIEMAENHSRLAQRALDGEYQYAR